MSHYGGRGGGGRGRGGDDRYGDQSGFRSNNRGNDSSGRGSSGWGTSAPPSGGAGGWGSSAPSSAPSGGGGWGASAPSSNSGGGWGSSAPSGGGGWGGNGGGGGGKYGPSSSGPSRDKFGSNSFDKLEKINWDLSQLPVFEKNFYIPHPAVTKRSQIECNDWRREKGITVIGDGIPTPCYTFEEASMPEYVHKEVIKQGFKAPTPIQSQGWPMALAGRDMIGISATGSGKTLAFLLPAMIHINAQAYLQPGDGPIVLVLEPTRELAMQVKKECDKFGASSSVKNTAIYGGVPKDAQIRDLRSGVEIVIACPGRLLDHLQSGNTNLKRVTYLVLDEADRMLDMGFEPQIRQIVSQIRPDRQTLMWSATWPKEVQQLSRQFQSNPYQVYVGNIETSANVMIKQVVEVCTDREKYMKLLDHLKGFTVDQRVLIFVETKIGAKSLTSSLSREGHRVNDIHGDKSQRERDTALAEFKSGRTPVLVATDVAARGIDVPDVRMVVNFDMPNNIEDYVHRIGRTGRAGAQGFAVTFFTDKHARMAKELMDILRGSGQIIPPELTKMRHY